MNNGHDRHLMPLPMSYLLVTYYRYCMGKGELEDTHSGGSRAGRDSLSSPLTRMQGGQLGVVSSAVTLGRPAAQ